MTYGFIKNVILREGKEKLTIEELPYGKRDLAPSISKDTIDYHYENLAKTYAKRYNAGEGDPDFNEAGVFLHNTLFPQYKKYDKDNTPSGSIEEFINKHFTSFAKFKEEFQKIAMSIQGSGWVYLSQSGKIKIIKNHEIKSDIVLLIDWWEHAWALDYQADKKDYLENQWYIINWEKVEERLR
jgi:Fe-Mn family superoxide dismutase